MYVYKATQRSDGGKMVQQQTVGFVDNTGVFHPLISLDTVPQALNCIRSLNGGMDVELVMRLVRSMESIASKMDDIRRHLP
jgi:hypothetical protein